MLSPLPPSACQLCPRLQSRQRPRALLPFPSLHDTHESSLLQTGICRALNACTVSLICCRELEEGLVREWWVWLLDHNAVWCHILTQPDPLPLAQAVCISFSLTKAWDLRVALSPSELSLHDYSRTGVSPPDESSSSSFSKILGSTGTTRSRHRGSILLFGA